MTNAMKMVYDNISSAIEGKENCIVVDLSSYEDKSICEKIVRSLQKGLFHNRAITTDIGTFLTICWDNKNIETIKNFI